MHKKLTLILALVAVLGFVGTSLAAPPFTVKQIITYDGYLYEDVTGGVLADTLFVVNNTNKSAVQLDVWIEVFDKHGNFVAEGTLFDGGMPLVNNKIPQDGFGWITLGMIVPRATVDPMENPLAEKFLVKISTGKGDPGATKPTTVEVKQVIYNDFQNPGNAIWNPALIKSWAETCLGGRRGPGVVKHPSGW